MFPRCVAWLNMNAHADSGGFELADGGLRNDGLHGLGCCLCRIRKREVASAGAHFRARRFYSYLDVVKTAVPLRAGRVEAERVCHARVIDRATEGAREVIRAVEGLASGALRQSLHGIKISGSDSGGKVFIPFAGKFGWRCLGIIS